ncbi:hypothetical protein HGT70_03950 [Rosenbergiella collisarenosi]|uniref:hypothetical protein n=1 Tax=Rosenbergiella collisarenosi TaxID=1544695 RepID=UPI001BDA052A|nr:hypothetical protein [Rosenbergiella collisarenosi]MBT0720433.1 hypothetical protein [Rosenbergiella collisarenosi]
MKIIQWLISLFTKESKPMTEPVTTEQPAEAVPAVATTPSTTDVYYRAEDVDKAFAVYFTALEHFELEEAKKVFEFVKAEILKPATK